MDTISEAWGFRHGQQVELRAGWLEHRGMRGRRDGRYEWHRAVVVGFTADRSIRVKTEQGSKIFTVANPKKIRPWRAPVTVDEIDEFLEGP